MTHEAQSSDPAARTGQHLFPMPTRALALLFLFVSAVSIWTNAFHGSQMDFISFWAASVLALDGNPAAAYDMYAHKAVQDQIASFPDWMPFPYPPPFLLLILPVGLLPYTLAAAVWVAGTYALYFLAAKRLLPDSGWLVACFPPVLLNGIMGQNGFLTGALFIGGALLLNRRPFVAGLLFGCLIIKPQLGMLLPFAFIAGRQWHAFAGASVSCAGLLLLALLVFGPTSYQAMAEILPMYGKIAAKGLVGWHKMAGVYSSLSLAGVPAAAAWAVHVGVALAALAVVWRVWRGPEEMPAKAAVLAAASVLVSPYLYVYDTVMLILPFFWLVKQEKDIRILVLLWLIPLINVAQSWGFNETVNLMPLVPISLLVLIWRRLYGRKTLGSRKLVPQAQ